VVRAGGQAREAVEVEAGVGAERPLTVLVRRLAQAVQARRHQAVAPALPLVPRRLQPVSQRHQLVDLGDDPALFGEGW
jgi:hypothetical protein